MGKMMKTTAIVALGGTMFLGCFNTWWGRLLLDAGLAAAYEFVWDNDSVFDLFQDDFGTATFYNDRFTAIPSRGEIGNIGDPL